MPSQTHFYVACCTACGRQAEAVIDRPEFERGILKQLRRWAALGLRVRPLAFDELNLQQHGEACPEANQRAK